MFWAIYPFLLSLFFPSLLLKATFLLRFYKDFSSHKHCYNQENIQVELYNHVFPIEMMQIFHFSFPVFSYILE